MIAFKIEDRLKISLYQVYHSFRDKSTACDILNQSLHDKAPGMLRGLMLYSVSKRYAVIVARAIMMKWTCVERFIGAPIDYGLLAFMSGRDFFAAKCYNDYERKCVTMTVAKIMKKMIDFSEGNTHDINHFMKVWTFAKTICELEMADEKTRFVIEIAAITHDIACPLCRIKYGNTNGKYQEIEGEPLVRKFLADTEMSQAQIDRVAYLVGHHHTLTNIDGLDYQILVEADYLVNADESSYSAENIANTKSKIFRTAAGIAILESIYERQCTSLSLT